MKNAFKRASLPGERIFQITHYTSYTQSFPEDTKKNSDKTARVKFKPNETEPIDTKRAISGPAKKDRKKNIQFTDNCHGCLNFVQRRASMEISAALQNPFNVYGYGRGWLFAGVIIVKFIMRCSKSL